MAVREASLVFCRGELLGAQLQEEDYVALGGQSLADAFDGHYVMLVRQPNGDFKVVDDIYACCFEVVHHVLIDVDGAQWSICDRQNEKVQFELEALKSAAAA